MSCVGSWVTHGPLRRANGNRWCADVFGAECRATGRPRMMNVRSIDYARPYWATVLTLENESVFWVAYIVWGLN